MESAPVTCAKHFVQKTANLVAAEQSLGILLVTSPLSRAGSPDEPALNCQHVFPEPNHSSGTAGLADQPSLPSSLALPSVLIRISFWGEPHL